MSEACAALHDERRPDDRVVPVVSAGGVAAAAGNPLVAAGAGGINEVQAARALHQVAADRRHVADLGRRARQNRAGEHRVLRARREMYRDGVVARGRADPQPAIVGRLDRVRQPGDVDQPRRAFDALAHQVDKVGAAAEQPLAVADCRSERLLDGGSAPVGDGDQATASAATCRMASTMPLCAPQRHRLPLIRSRTSSRDRWTGAVRSAVM